MNIPSKERCFQMIREMKMMDHIVAHSIRVCQVAMCLTDQLNIKGEHLNRDLIQAAALLHDITKTRSFDTQENHAETARDMVMDAGYPEVGDIIGQHVQLKAYPRSGAILEAEVINYSDKRVLHDQVVSLMERFKYIADRYARVPSDLNRVQLLSEKARGLEKRIFKCLDFSPALLETRLSPEVFTAEFNAYFNDRNMSD